MGFPNVDTILVQRLVDRFVETQMNPGFVIDDTFAGTDSNRKAEIARYLNRKQFTTDLRKRDEAQVYVFPHFPMLDMPLPQIAINLGQENPADRFISDWTGESMPVEEGGETVAWDMEKGYLANASYTIDVVCATKDETIWLSRLIQRFLCESQGALAGQGVSQVNISLADMRPDQAQTPMTVFNRRITLTCLVENTWFKRVPVQEYETGINKGLEG